MFIMQEEASSLPRTMCSLLPPEGSRLCLPASSQHLTPSSCSVQIPWALSMGPFQCGPSRRAPLVLQCSENQCPDSAMTTFPGWLKSPQGLPVHGTGIWHIHGHQDKQDQLKSCFNVGGALRPKDKRWMQRLIFDMLYGSNAD